MWSSSPSLPYRAVAALAPMMGLSYLNIMLSSCARLESRTLRCFLRLANRPTGLLPSRQHLVHPQQGCPRPFPGMWAKSQLAYSQARFRSQRIGASRRRKRVAFAWFATLHNESRWGAGTLCPVIEVGTARVDGRDRLTCASALTGARYAAAPPGALQTRL